MRVLFTTTPGRGHYHPMLPLAIAFRERGHEVLWVSADDACARLRELGWEAMSAGLPESITSGGLAERYPEVMALAPAERPNFLFSKIFGPDRAGPMLFKLLPIVLSWQPSLLVCDQAELAGPIAAAVVDVPNVTHAFGHPLPRVRLERAAEEMAALWHSSGLPPRPFAGTYDHLYLDIYPDSLKADDISHIPEIQQIRPATPATTDSHPPDDVTALVYVTFGTVFTDDLTPIRTVVEAIRELPVRVIATLGPGNDPQALGDQPPNVSVSDYIPQAEVLPRAAAVISHAGSGTFLAALAAGLPQLLLPQAADQFLNAKAGAGAGAGIEIAPEQMSAWAIREGLQQLLNDDGYRQAARAVRDEIAAMPAPDAVAQELERRFA